MIRLRKLRLTFRSSDTAAGPEVSSVLPHPPIVSSPSEWRAPSEIRDDIRLYGDHDVVAGARRFGRRGPGFRGQGFG